MDELEQADEAYERGQKSVYRDMLATALRGLGTDSPEWNAHRWQKERSDIVAMLRMACAECGDNDWPDDLHLADVIEKHLWAYSPETADEES